MKKLMIMHGKMLKIKRMFGDILKIKGLVV